VRFFCQKSSWVILVVVDFWIFQDDVCYLFDFIPFLGFL